MKLNFTLVVMVTVLSVLLLSCNAVQFSKTETHELWKFERTGNGSVHGGLSDSGFAGYEYRSLNMDSTAVKVGGVVVVLFLLYKLAGR